MASACCLIARRVLERRSLAHTSFQHQLQVQTHLLVTKSRSHHKSLSRSIHTAVVAAAVQISCVTRNLRRCFHCGPLTLAVKSLCASAWGGDSDFWCPGARCRAARTGTVQALRARVRRIRVALTPFGRPRHRRPGLNMWACENPLDRTVMTAREPKSLEFNGHSVADQLDRR